MTTADQRQKAQLLAALHTGEHLLVLPNVWDPIGARVLAHKGYPAVATASAAVSSSLGYRDGETISRDTMLEVVSRIARAVDVPLTADMESGYAVSVDALAETTRGLIDSGAVGMNIEDSPEEGGPLRPIEEQAERIAQVREVASSLDVPLVINARIDSFLSGDYSNIEERVEDAVMRAGSYVRAGADCVYPIGPGDVETLELLRSRIASPINALATPDAAPLQTLAAIGINRVSFGPFIFRSCLQKFADIADALARSEGYGCFGRKMMPRSDLNTFLRSEHEDEAT